MRNIFAAIFSSFILVGCGSAVATHAERPTKTSPYGIVMHSMKGNDRKLQLRREDAMKKMQEECGGGYKITDDRRDGPDWIINYKCAWGINYPDRAPRKVTGYRSLIDGFVQEKRESKALENRRKQLELERMELENQRLKDAGRIGQEQLPPL